MTEHTSPAATNTQSSRSASRPHQRGGLVELLYGVGHESEASAEDFEEVEVEESIEGGGRVGLIVLGVALLAAIGGIAWLLSSPERKEELKAFFAGQITEYKMRGVRAQEERWNAIDRATRNLYGSVTLEYFPKTARVDVVQLRWKEPFDKYVKRVLDGAEDTRGEPERKEIPNRTHELKEHEVVESLPLKNLPIREKSEEKNKDGDPLYVYTYAYEVTISAPEYYPRKFLFISDDYPGTPPKDVDVLKWDNPGPGIWTIPWKGADLRPKPELMKDKYVRALVEFNCYKADPAHQKMSEEELHDIFRNIQLKHGFATEEQWSEVDTALRGNAELWPQIEEQIKAGVCEQPKK